MVITKKETFLDRLKRQSILYNIRQPILISAVLYAFWLYSNKFLSYSAEYVGDMSRDLSFGGVQQNIAYYSTESLILYIGGFLLLCYLLVQNEFRYLFDEPRQFKDEGSFPVWLRESLNALQNMPLWITACSLATLATASSLSVLVLAKLLVKGLLIGLSLGLFVGFLVRGYKSSFFAMFMFLMAYLIVPGLALSTSATSFFFIGGAVLTSFLLIQDNIHELLSPPWAIEDFKQIPLLSSLLSIIFFVILIFQISFLPIISENLITILSLILLINVSFWTWNLSQEQFKPSVQEHRTAALVFMIALPILLYFMVRFMYLLNHPDAVMRNRWELSYEFMELGNTFRVNTWPFEVEPGADSRWLFYKAAILNSARVTLLSIFLCTILGIIVGVTRLSSNKLASGLATAYVEIFRNLPLAVLLFLIATQMGHQLPLFSEEKSLFGLLYYSNQGIWFVSIAEYSRLFLALIVVGLVRLSMRHLSRVEPSRSVQYTSIIKRPFYMLGWKMETLLTDIFVLSSLSAFVILSYPFLTTSGGGLSCIVGFLLMVYSLYVFTNVDGAGMNQMVIDDSPEGLRRSFFIWTISFAVAIGIAVSGGFSHPELLKPSTSPGSWRFAAEKGFEITPAFSAMIIGLTLFTASVVAEIVRGSIQALPRGQVEAAISLGLSPFQRLRLVILPQALRSMIPLLNNQFMNVWKNSSLAIIVAYNDVFYQFVVMANNVGKLIPLFLLLLVTYQFGSLMMSAIMNWFNARVTSVKI